MFACKLVNLQSTFLYRQTIEIIADGESLIDPPKTRMFFAMEIAKLFDLATFLIICLAYNLNKSLCCYFDTGCLLKVYLKFII